MTTICIRKPILLCLPTFVPEVIKVDEVEVDAIIKVEEVIEIHEGMS